MDRSDAGMTGLIRFMLVHLLYGTVGALVAGALILLFDVGGILTLARQSRDSAIFIFLLFFGLFVTFGGISIAAGIMTLGDFNDNDRYRDERNKK